MSEPVVVQIVGAPTACAEGIKESWREMAHWADGQLRNRFGDAVRVEYYDLFDPTCPSLPADAQLPLVIVNGELLSSGGKLPMPAIRKRVEDILG
ncbi:hypothetical protein VZO05_10260 [Aggregatilineales bacterium SYSU G02658]